MFELFNDDIIKWCAEYKGEKFHAILTDPPYHLTSIAERFGKENSAPAQFGTNGAFSRASKGFMGKTWDGGDIAFKPETWKALAEHLHDGGFIMAFASSRGFHRQAIAMEDAGLIIHPFIGWTYGCLSEDTEILTEWGWANYDQIRKTKGLNILTFNKDTDKYGFEVPSKWNVYNIKDTCFRVQSDDTDQIVSRNHRCLIEREGKLLFNTAEELASEQEANIPFLESLSDLSKDIPNLFKGRSNEEQNLFKRMFLSFAKENQETKSKNNSFRTAKENDYQMCGLWEGSNPCQFIFKEIQSPFMWERVQIYMAEEKSRSNGINEENIAFRHNSEQYSRTQIQEMPLWFGQSCLERWNNISEQEGLLRKSEYKICEMPDRISFNGGEGWICDGIQISNGTTNQQTAFEDGMCASFRPQSREQQDREFNTFQGQYRPQEIRTRATYKTTLATMTPIRYKGIVYCPTVSTGAFVARRNGKIFLTGNSGFPKATDVSKQIDKQAGAEREVIGRNPNSRENCDKTNTLYESGTVGKTDYLTEPKTEQAKIWEGHKYGLQALKPAIEPILVAQKPYKGKPVECIVRTGAGALNIDGGRIGTDELMNGGGSFATGEFANSLKQGANTNNDGIVNFPYQQHNLGRFPANFILSHVGTTVYILSGKTPIALYNLICKYYHGYNGVQTMRERNGCASKHSEIEEILQYQMCCGIKEENNISPYRNELQMVWENIYLPAFSISKWQEEILQSGVQKQSEWFEEGRITSFLWNKTTRINLCENQGNSEINPPRDYGREAFLVQGGMDRTWWIQNGVYTEQIPNRNRNIETDGDKGNLCIGTQDDYGFILEKTTFENGDSSSQEWEQNRQSNREFGIDRTWEALKISSRNDTRDSEIESGERPLEVLDIDIPAGWGRYFEQTLETYSLCVCKGDKKVKGNGHYPDNGAGFVSEHGIYNGNKKYEIQQDDLKLCNETISDWDCPEYCPVRILGEQSGLVMGSASRFFFNSDYTLNKIEEADTFYYCAKAGRSERDKGLDDFEEKETNYGSGGGGMPSGNNNPIKTMLKNPHPTVKPLKLTKYLATLLKPPKEYKSRILVPFAGVGSEMIGCILAGWDEVIGVELTEEYIPIAKARLEYWEKQNKKENTQTKIIEED